MGQIDLGEVMQSVAGDRHKLVILLGDFASGKTAEMKRACAAVGGTYVNLNLCLSDVLLAIPRSQYADGVTVHRLIDELCDELSPDGQPLFVDNVELLFSPDLGRINPVDTFKRIARQRPVLLALPARLVGSNAEYSTLDRADHMVMPLEDFIVIDINEDSRL